MEAVAMHDFVPNDPDGELAFKKGDNLRILNFGDQVQWYNAEMNGQVGLVPGNYIEIEKPKWYFGRISRSKAEQILMSSELKDGAFLVRLSESAPQEFSLSVKCSSSVQHFRILKDDEHRYFLWNERFNSVNKLVENYKKETVSRTSQLILKDMDFESHFLAEAIYDFFPEKEDQDGETELYFKKGEIITVFDTSDNNWWGGRIEERHGFFPRLYVKQYVPLPPSNNHS